MSVAPVALQKDLPALRRQWTQRDPLLRDPKSCTVNTRYVLAFASCCLYVQADWSCVQLDAEPSLRNGRV